MQPSDKKTLTAVFFIFSLALALRLLTGVYLGFNAPPDFDACGADAVEYEALAHSLQKGEGYSLDDHPTAFRAPGYPLFLSLFYTLFGHHFWINKVLLSVIGALSCVGLFFLVRLLLANDRIATIVGLIMAVFPLQLYYTGHFTSEPLAIFLNILITIVMVKSLSAPDPKTALKLCFLAGLLCGYSTLTRSANLIYPVMLFGLLFAMQGRSRECLQGLIKGAAIFILGMVLIMAPWAIRNKIVLGKPVLVATNGGSTFWGANNAIVADPRSGHWGGWISTNRLVGESLVKSEFSEVALEKREWQEGVTYLKNNPGQIPGLLLGKFLRLMNPVPQSPNRKYVALIAASTIFFLPFFIFGIYVAIRQKIFNILFIPVWAHILVMLAVTIIFYGTERLRTPYQPFLMIYTAIGLNFLLKRKEKNNHSKC